MHRSPHCARVAGTSGPPGRTSGRVRGPVPRGRLVELLGKEAREGRSSDSTHGHRTAGAGWEETRGVPSHVPEGSDQLPAPDERWRVKCDDGGSTVCEGKLPKGKAASLQGKAPKRPPSRKDAKGLASSNAKIPFSGANHVREPSPPEDRVARFARRNMLSNM